MLSTLIPTQRSVFRLNVLAATAVLALGLAAGRMAIAGEKDKPAEAAGETFVGKLEGGPESARIAIVIQGTRFTGYTCSQDEDFNDKHSIWYNGQVDAQGRFDATAGKARLTGQRSGDGLSLTLKSEDKEFSATAGRVPEDRAAGLYRDDTLIQREVWVSGWIIDTEGNVVGLSVKVDVDPEKLKKQAKTAKLLATAAAINPALVPVAAAAKIAKNVKDKRAIPNRVNVVQAGPGVGSGAVPPAKKRVKKEPPPKQPPPKEEQNFDVDEVQEGTLDIQELSQQTFAQVSSNAIKLSAGDRGAFLTGMKVAGARAAAIRKLLTQGAGEGTLLPLAGTLNDQIQALKKRAEGTGNEQLQDLLDDMAEKSKELVDDLG